MLRRYCVCDAVKLKWALCREPEKKNLIRFTFLQANITNWFFFFERKKFHQMTTNFASLQRKNFENEIRKIRNKIISQPVICFGVLCVSWQRNSHRVSRERTNEHTHAQKIQWAKFNWIHWFPCLVFSNSFSSFFVVRFRERVRISLAFSRVCPLSKVEVCLCVCACTSHLVKLKLTRAWKRTWPVGSDDRMNGKLQTTAEMRTILKCSYDGKMCFSSFLSTLIFHSSAVRHSPAPKK